MVGNPTHGLRISIMRFFTTIRPDEQDSSEMKWHSAPSDKTRLINSQTSND